jgi:hypothetical protein
MAILYQTIAVAPADISLPSMAVKPAINTKKCK